MNDMSAVIVPKSDQINADDLIDKTMTVTIRDVKITAGQEQPVAMRLEETDKVYRPCKIMSRLMVRMWGPDAGKYAGKSMTLYRDPNVKWGALTVGGIRISHMSHINGEQTVVLQEKRGALKPHVIKPLKAKAQQDAANERTEAEQADVEKRTDAWATKYIAALKDAVTDDEIAGIRKRQAEKLAWVRDNYRDIYARVIEADPHSAVPDPADAGLIEAE